MGVGNKEGVVFPFQRLYHSVVVIKANQVEKYSWLMNDVDDDGAAVSAFCHSVAV